MNCLCSFDIARSLTRTMETSRITGGLARAFFNHGLAARDTRAAACLSVVLRNGAYCAPTCAVTVTFTPFAPPARAARARPSPEAERWRDTQSAHDKSPA